MTEDQFRTILNDVLAKQAGYIEQRLKQIEAKVDGVATAEQIDRVYRAVDSIAKGLETDEQERAAITVEQNRHRTWIGQLAKSTNTKLVPEQ